MVAIFILSVALILSHYIIYPGIVYLISRFFPKNHTVADCEPSVSFIIAAYNEQAVIKQKIENTLALDYPKNKMQIIVVSDGSSDKTPEIAAIYKNDGVLSLFDPPRKGKTSALNRAVAEASGEILVFSDANTFFEKKSIRMLCRHFKDKTVGGVSGLKCIFPDESRASSIGDSLYWKYEALIKKSESKIGSIAGADGEIFAMRKNLYVNINNKVINDDAALTFEIVRKGARVLYDTEARTVEYASFTLKDDFNVKVRMIVGGFQTIELYLKFLLNPINSFAWQFFFHKILRWIIPVFMITAFVSNVFLLQRSIYLALFLFQILFYLTSIMGWFFYLKNIKIKMFYVPFYFCVMNVAALKALFVWIRNRSLDPASIWKKAKR